MEFIFNYYYILSQEFILLYYANTQCNKCFIFVYTGSINAHIDKSNSAWLKESMYLWEGYLLKQYN